MADKRDRTTGFYEPEALKAYYRQYYADHKDKMNASNAAYKERNKERLAAEAKERARRYYHKKKAELAAEGINIYDLRDKEKTRSGRQTKDKVRANHKKHAPRTRTRERLGTKKIKTK